MQPEAETIAASLARIPLFAGLAPAELQGLAERTGSSTYAPDETVFSAGDAGETLYLIASGLVRIILPSTSGDGDAIVVLMVPGEFFGELALLDGLPRSATAVAMAPTETLTISRADFIAFLTEQPKASLAVLATLSRRLRRADELIRDAMFLDVPMRLGKKLMELVSSFGEQGPEGIDVAIPISDRELAAMVGTTEDVVRSRLSQLEAEGILKRRGEGITVLQPDRLHTAGGWS